MPRLIKQIIRDRSGATAIEYGLIAALIVVAIMGSVVGLAGSIQSSYSRTGDAMTMANS